MRFSWRVELPLMLMVAAMFVVGACVWPYVPERLPVHWNAHGEVDGYGDKFTGLFLLPIIVAGIYLLMLLLPLIDPGRRNYENFAKAYNIIRLAILVFMALIYALSVLAAFGKSINMTTVIAPAMGILFIVLGNFMGKIRPNWFVGVRTPWTLSSKLSWDKTHRLAGWLFMFMGALWVAYVVVPTAWMLTTILVIDGLCCVWLVVYSYLVYRADPQRLPPAGTSPGVE